jgi:hypothetical protein
MHHHTSYLPDSGPSNEKSTPLSVFANYPCFVKPLVCSDNPELVNYIDFWVVEPLGDWDLDTEIGEQYADLAVMHAKVLRQPEFVACVLAFINYKARHGLLPAQSEAVVHGFFRRLAKLAYLGSMN